jgi:hypothetical protein
VEALEDVEAWPATLSLVPSRGARASVARQKHAECGRVMAEIAASYAHLAELRIRLL